MGYYNDVVIQIDKKDQDRFEDYLKSDYMITDRVLEMTPVIKETSSGRLVYIWMNDNQLRGSARNHYFSIECEMERAGFEPDDYVAEMWEEDGEHQYAGNMDIEYYVQMNAFVYDEEEKEWV